MCCIENRHGTYRSPRTPKTPRSKSRVAATVPKTSGWSGIASAADRDDCAGLAENRGADGGKCERNEAARDGGINRKIARSFRYHIEAMGHRDSFSTSAIAPLSSAGPIHQPGLAGVADPQRARTAADGGIRISKLTGARMS